MRKLLLALLLLSHVGFAQSTKKNPMDYQVKHWIEKSTRHQYNQAYIDSLDQTRLYQISMYKDSIVGNDTIYLTFEKQLIADVKKAEDAWRNGITGKKLVDFKLKDSQGKLIDKRSLNGKFVIADFSSVFCGPCLREISLFNQLKDTLKNRNVEIIGFFPEDTTSMHEVLSTPALIKNLFNGKPIQFSYVVIPGAREIIDHYKIQAFPTHMLIDPQGVIRKVLVGAPHDEKTNKFTVVETMLAELKSIGLK